MSFIGNILWFIFGGLLMGLLYIFFGLLFCITIIGIPFGYQLIKIGLFVFHPFGNSPQFRADQPDALRLIFNVIWIVLGWFHLAVMHVVFGLICCITIVGIPFGLQHFKIARLSLFPFGSSAS